MQFYIKDHVECDEEIPVQLESYSEWNDTNISFMHLTCVETADETCHSLVRYEISSSPIE